MIGKVFYGEWLYPIVDYYATLKRNERNYEIVFPIVVAALSIGMYFFYGDTFRAIMKLRDILPNALAILIGFTISCVTVLVSSDNATITLLKEKESDGRVVRSKVISMYQWMLITFIYILIVQVFLLAFVFFVAFILQLHHSIAFLSISLFIEAYTMLHILLLIIRNITNFYFVFYVQRRT